MGIANPQIVVCDILEMENLAFNLSKKLFPGMIIALCGEVGSGKTTFTKMLCKYLSITSEVLSPTYTYLSIYDEKVAHFDLYRLKSHKDFFSLGFEEYFEGDYITIIEWPELIKSYLPENTIFLDFSHKDNKRRIKINGQILF
jgi:tRNA threonylcarbamoyladenosine biosynthesis protein TsaE